MPYSVINDPIHGLISFPSDWKDLLKNIIDSSSFQRLRHIKQLGMLDLIFPTAVHNRFSHSLGAAYLAFRIGQNLKMDLNKLRHTMIAALLHDIGHGPFSHMFEELYKTIGVSFSVKHEEWTICFLKEYESILDSHKVDYQTITKLIKRDVKDESWWKEWGLASDIVSSQLDADRLDYLLRDSHFCGVGYGNVELEWILNHLVSIEVPKNAQKLGLEKKGWRAVEHFLLARRFMHQNVYQHPKNRILENLIVNFLASVSRVIAEDEKILGFEFQNTNLKKFLKNIYIAKASSNNVSKDDFIRENYNYYKTLVDFDIWMLIRGFSLIPTKSPNSAIEEICCIARRIYERKLHACRKVEPNSLKVVESIVDQFCKERGLPSWKVFLTANEIKLYGKSGKVEEIFVKDEHQIIRDITYYSSLLEAHHDQMESEYHLAYDVFLDKKLVDELLERINPYIF